MEKYFENESYTRDKKKLFENIIEENMQSDKSNHFWYKNCSENVRTYIHKRGKREGYMCHKKIRANLGDNKQDFLCCTHSKNHIRKKRTSKMNSNQNIIGKDKVEKKVLIIN